MAIKLYPKVEVKGLDFTGVKDTCVPNQSMSLDEIVRRYVRREPLNVNHNEAFYEERFGDLEKIAKGDLVEQEAAIIAIKAKMDALKSDIEKAHEKYLLQQKLKISQQSNQGTAPNPVVGGPPLNSPGTGQSLP